MYRSKELVAAVAFAVSALSIMPCTAATTAVEAAQSAGQHGSSYADLVRMFGEWRAFVVPLNTAVPDYTPASVAARASALRQWQQRLAAIPTAGWPIEQANDYRLVQAEMNGLDFQLRVTQPWARDPAFYAVVWAQRTDVPLREGPLAVPEISLYNYNWPLAAADQRDLLTKVRIVPGLLQQAKANLQVSNARDLWVYGSRELRNQAAALASLQAGTLTVSTVGRTQHADLTGVSPELRTAIADAQQSTEEFAQWLDSLAATKTGPSGVGKQNYTWYEQNVHLLPYSWEDQVVLLRRELERAQASLRLEEHRNRNLPPLEPVSDQAAFDRLTRDRVNKFLNFLVEQQIIPDKPYLKEVVRKELLGKFAPEGQRAFFTQVIHLEPMLLLSHDYHWVDLGRMRDEPNPSSIRRVASESNIWDTRAEGFATAFEELAMHAGLYDDNPRAKELVWIMLANRAARGLASLYVQANELDLKAAGQFHARWTPRHYANAGDKLTAFEQLLYLRQPGYGASYIVGKVQFDRLLTEWSMAREDAGQPFVLRDLMDRFNNDGMVPFSLIESELIPAADLDHPDPESGAATNGSGIVPLPGTSK